MRYVTSVTVQPNTVNSNPAIGSLAVPRGLIVKTVISFLNTVNGSVYAVVTLAGLQLYPNNIGSCLAMNQSPIEIPDNYPLFPKEGKIEILAWSNGNRYPHTLQLGVDVLPFSTDVRRVR